MRNIRVLVVDDSVVVRKIVSDTLSQDQNIEVVGVAANGNICLQKIPQVNPDAVTLDVEMPEMDGLTALREIRKVYPTLPVIMFSTLTERGGTTTLEALSLGASDYVTKPSNVGVAKAMQLIKDELIPKIKVFCSQATGVDPSPSIPVFDDPKKLEKIISKPQVIPKNRIDLVAIGVSTGGPNALAELIPTIPVDFPVPIVIVQHMPPYFTQLLAERLTAKSQIKVVEGANGQVLEAGTAIIAPGNFHMTLKKINNSIIVDTNQDPPVHSCRPSADVLFRSAINIYNKNMLGVVLTGMGQDGLTGCEELFKAGGKVVVQDEETSVVWGMPGFVAKAGYAHRIMPLKQIGQEIVISAKLGRMTSASS